MKKFMIRKVINIYVVAELRSVYQELIAQIFLVCQYNKITMDLIHFTEHY